MAPGGSQVTIVGRRTRQTLLGWANIGKICIYIDGPSTTFNHKSHASSQHLPKEHLQAFPGEPAHAKSVVFFQASYRMNLQSQAICV